MSPIEADMISDTARGVAADTTSDSSDGLTWASGSAVPSRLPSIITDERMAAAGVEATAAQLQLDPGLGVRGGVHDIKF